LRADVESHSHIADGLADVWCPVQGFVSMNGLQTSAHFRLIVASLVIAVVWCVGLPWIATIPAVDHRLQFLDERGIDPSAMFYTELESMKPILRRVDNGDFSANF